MAPAISEDAPNGEASQASQNKSTRHGKKTSISTLDAKGTQETKPKTKEKASDAQDSPKGQNEVKLSGKELKERNKAEKAARREREKQGRQGQPTADLLEGQMTRAQIQSEKPQNSGQVSTTQAKPHHRRKSSASAHTQKSLPIRPATTEAHQKPEEPKKEDKRLPFFQHLYGHPRRHTIAGASKDVHPSVLALGLQLSSYEICGSNARCIATLLVLKEVITAYVTPQGTSLPRHLTTHLANQIDYLVSCRPLSVSQGNAIRWLKVKISAVDVSTAEDQAKKELCEAIDSFIRERIIVADDVIAESASERIQDGDVVMTYGRSSIVGKTLIEAHKQKKRFSVIVVDSRPLFEGKYLAETLVNLGIEVEYSLITGLSHVAPTATKTILGAHATMANGRLYSRVGTAMVAMMAKDSQVPVMVCCETIKLTERVALDSFVHNELAPEDELIPVTADGPKSVLEDWRDVPNFQLLNMMYDLTPPELIDVVITENGNMPPHRIMVY